MPVASRMKDKKRNRPVRFIHPQMLNSGTWNLLIDSVDTVMLDCDGVLWRGNKAINGSPEAVRYLRELGKRVILLTNNGTRSQADHLQKTKNLGFDIEGEDHIVTVSHVTAHYLKAVRNFTGKVYVLGSTGIGHELDNVKIEHTGIGPDPTEMFGGTFCAEDIKLDPQVKAVVVGYDQHFSYMKLMKAASYLRNPSCLFVATNDDNALTGFEGPQIVSPETGSLLAAVTAATGRRPTILGKPYEPIFKFLQMRFNVDPSRTLMIGDNISTDMKLARTFGMRSLFVLSGVCQRADFENAKLLPFLPEYFTNRLGDISDL